ncbi:IMPACT family protein [Leifsonia poae]|uniref:IMPACT family protein n=1 Tax=Leifsonia poae TaxID=110933 RepID=UPI001CC15D71|nr:YigZ family protein [Leifsonia poae]
MPIHTLAAPATAEIEVRRSRFLAVAMPVADREAGMTELAALRRAHPGATHVCWALLAGGQSGMSDDGEPSGTAGRPILEVLRHHDLDGVVAAVVRYYGGVRLGAGGLVRAYTEAIATALRDATLIEHVPSALLAAEADYSDAERIRHWAGTQGFEVLDADYGTTVRLTVRLPETALGTARDALQDLTQGRATIARAPDTHS